MSDYPIAYSQHPPVQRNRLTVFFRLFMLIPHWFVSIFYGIAVFFALVGAWFAILFTGRYPPGIYDFVSGYLRFNTRLLAYAYLIVDEFPPFDGGEHPEYPVQVKIGPPPASSSRLLTFFRGILSIPIWFMQAVFSYWIAAVAIAMWFVAVITGKTEASLPNAVRFPMSYYARSTGYLFLMTDQYPPISDDTATYVQVAPAA